MREVSEIRTSPVVARDGEVGSVRDLLVDERTWKVRWVVVSAGGWLNGRRVLLSPFSLVPASPSTPTALREFQVDLTREQVKQSPEVDADAPVSRQMERDIHEHYGWEPYWATPYLPMAGAVGAVPPAAAVPPEIERTDVRAASPKDETDGDPCLRSLSEVTGYYVQAKDGEIGHIEDFLLDEDGWAVRYAIVDTRNWWPGKLVLVSPDWAREIDWSAQRFHVGLTRDQVKESPEFDRSAVVDRAYEERLYGHYGFPPYWV